MSAREIMMPQGYVHGDRKTDIFKKFLRDKIDSTW